MTETLDPMAATEVDQKQLAEQLLAQAREQGVELMGPNGLLNQLTKNVLETALDAEMTEHLGYEKHDAAGRGSGNSRNGTRSKIVLTEIGPVEIDVPRDIDSSFAPQIVKKRQRRLTGIDEIVLSLTAKGLTTGEVSAHFQDIYGATVSKDTISRITDKVVGEMTEWQNRPLERGRFLLVVANHRVVVRGHHRRTAWAGVRSFRHNLGRSLSSAATSSSWSWVQPLRSVPFGKYCRRRPFVFSLDPRCHGEWGSAK